MFLPSRSIKHYRTIHDRKRRGKKRKNITEELLISSARDMFKQMRKEKFIRELAKSFDDLSVRIDLVGTPEVSFVIAVQKGKLKFLTEHLYTDIAVGIHKEYFLELLEKPPELGNMKILYNNVIFRKGVVKLFKYAKPLLSSTFSVGRINKIIRKNKLAKVR